MFDSIVHSNKGVYVHRHCKKKTLPFRVENVTVSFYTEHTDKGMHWDVVEVSWFDVSFLEVDRTRVVTTIRFSLNSKRGVSYMK